MERDLGDPAREFVGLGVVAIDRCRVIHADVEAFEPWHRERNAVRDPMAVHSLSIDAQRTDAPLAETTAVVCEAEHDLVLAGRERARALPTERFKLDKVVGECRLPAIKPQRVPTKTAAV